MSHNRYIKVTRAAWNRCDKTIDIEGQDVIVTFNCRAGSASIRQTLKHGEVLHQVEAYEQRLAGVPVIFVIRNPYDRLASCWHLASSGPSNGLTMDGISHKSFEFFCRHIISNTNKHWEPQVMTQTTGDGMWVPSVTVPLEHINEWWPRTFDRPLQHLNKVDHATWDELSPLLDDDTRDLINKHYHWDLVTWGAAEHKYNLSMSE